MGSDAYTGQGEVDEAGSDAGVAGGDIDRPPSAGDASSSDASDAPDCGALAPSPQAGPDPGMVLVPAGPFWRGCNTAVDNQCDQDELPGSCITLSAFEIDKTEITQAQYQAFLSDAGYEIPTSLANCRDVETSTYFHPETTPNWPVSCVSWYDATAFCQWEGKRLPTEAEYEKGSRGTDGRIYPWGNEPDPNCQLANYGACFNGDVTSPNFVDVGVATGASPYGEVDATSNVVEWTNDFYASDYYAMSPTQDPQGPSCPDAGSGPDPIGCLTVWHGSAVDGPPTGVRTSWRTSGYPWSTVIGLGFRCAKTVN